jgi:virginiamycin B lyase
VSGAVTEDIGLETVYPRIPRLRLSRVDPQTNRVVGEIDTEILCCGELAAGAGSLWSLDRAEQAAIRVDPIGETVTADLAVGGHDVAVGEGRVWILDTIAGSIRSVVPRTAEIDRVIPLSGSPTAIAAGEGAVWVSDRASILLKVPVSGNAGIDTASVGQGAEDVAIGEGAVWVANAGDGTVSRVDPVTADVVATIPVPGTPTKLAVGEGGVWVIVRAD